MINKSVKIADFSGINNVAKGEQLSQSELTTAFNLDLTNAKSLRRRQGRRSIYQGDCHSVFSDGDYLYFRSGTTLVRLNTIDNSYVTLKSGLTVANRMEYLPLNGKLYYSDSVNQGVIDAGSDRSWGIEAPTQPVVADTVGDLTGGTYRIAITYARADGQESGACPVVLMRSISGGIDIQSIPQSTDTGVAYIIVYLSPANTSSLYRFTIVAHGTTSMIIRGGDVGSGPPLMTEFLNSPPTGQLIENYNGRIYIAAGDVLWYTNPYQYEHVDYRFNYMHFDGRISMLKAVDNGLWVGAGGLAHFVGGEDALNESAPMGIRFSYAYPAIEGTALVADGKLFGKGDIVGKVAVWTSKNGICVGTSDGTLLNATEKRFKPKDVSQGVATLVQSGDFNQYLLALNVGPNGGTVRLPQFRT